MQTETIFHENKTLCVSSNQSCSVSDDGDSIGAQFKYIQFKMDYILFNRWRAAEDLYNSLHGIAIRVRKRLFKGV